MFGRADSGNRFALNIGVVSTRFPINFVLCADRFVDSEHGSDANDCKSFLTSCLTLQHVVDSAGDKDTVHIRGVFLQCASISMFSQCFVRVGKYTLKVPVRIQQKTLLLVGNTTSGTPVIDCAAEAQSAFTIYQSWTSLDHLEVSFSLFVFGFVARL